MGIAQLIIIISIFLVASDFNDRLQYQPTTGKWFRSVAHSIKVPSDVIEAVHCGATQRKENVPL